MEERLLAIEAEAARLMEHRARLKGLRDEAEDAFHMFRDELVQEEAVRRTEREQAEAEWRRELRFRPSCRDRVRLDFSGCWQMRLEQISAN